MKYQNKMKHKNLLVTSILMTIVSAIFLGVFSYAGCYFDYVYERDFLSHWTLADKASTIPAKKQHIEDFYNALNKPELFALNNALIFKTNDNSYKKNLEALKTLCDRLKEIEKMSPSSFEYNTAIQQITAQEQGEASRMLSTIKGCWYLHNHMFFWDWINLSIFIFFLLLLGVSILVTIFCIGIECE